MEIKLKTYKNEVYKNLRITKLLFHLNYLNLDLDNFVELKDHKGELTVTTKQKLSVMDRIILKRLWNEEFCEPHVEFKVDNNV